MMDPVDFDAQTAWNTGAAAYIDFVESGADYYRHFVHGPGLLAACGDVQGAQALDIGCGQGYFSRLLAQRGAAVTAVDLSEDLLARAVALESGDPLGIVYLHLDAARIATHFGEGSFDLVTACMSLQDMWNPVEVLAAAHLVLRPHGRVVFSVPHPCTDLPFRQWQRESDGNKGPLCLDRYFETGPTVCHWNMERLLYRWSTPYYRLTLTQWSRLIADTGFVIRSLTEPRPDDAILAAQPQLADSARMPFFLVFDVEKRSPRHDPPS